MQYKPECRYIASIYPGKLPTITRYYGETPHHTGKDAKRSTPFSLVPVPRGGKPYVIQVWDSFESVLDIVGSGGLTRGQKAYMAKPVPAEDIVKDILTHWTGNLFNVPAGASPGIIEVANSTATQADIRRMEQMQTMYFEYLYTEGKRLAQEHLWKEISDTMRLAADYLGYKETWSHRDIARDSSECPFCTELIPNSALKCKFCGEKVREYPAHLAKLADVVPEKVATT